MSDAPLGSSEQRAAFEGTTEQVENPATAEFLTDDSASSRRAATPAIACWSPFSASWARASTAIVVTTVSILEFVYIRFTPMDVNGVDGQGEEELHRRDELEEEGANLRSGTGLETG